MKLTVRARLFMGFGLLIIAMVALGLYSSWSLRKVNYYTEEIAQNWMPGVQYIQSVDALVGRYRTQEYHYITAGNDNEKYLAEQNMRTIDQQINQGLADFEKTIEDENSRKMFKDISDSLEKYMQLSGKAINLSRQDNAEESINILESESDDAFNTLSANIAKEVKYDKDNGMEASTKGVQLYHQAETAFVVAIVIAALLGLGVAYFTSRSVSNPLKELESLSNRMAGGDLSVKDAVVRNRDEIGSVVESFNKMKNSLREVISGLVTTTTDLSAMAEELSSQAQQTAAAASESAATVGEIASTIDQVAQDTQEVAAISGETSREAAQGSEGIDQVTGRMREVAVSSNKASGVVDSLSHTLNRVNQIVELITSIADQTNLLALNAAIEAARAGEQGRGFAVVAEEVRKLAEQSASAARNISQLIGTVDAESQKAVEAMRSSNQQVKEGSALIEEVGQRFKGIIDRVESLANQIQNVASATEQVSTGVQNVSASTEEQTAAMEEVSAATEQLNKIAFDLSGMAQKFKL